MSYISYYSWPWPRVEKYVYYAYPNSTHISISITGCSEHEHMNNPMFGLIFSQRLNNIIIYRSTLRMAQRVITASCCWPVWLAVGMNIDGWIRMDEWPPSDISAMSVTRMDGWSFSNYCNTVPVIVTTWNVIIPDSARVSLAAQLKSRRWNRCQSKRTRNAQVRPRCCGNAVFVPTLINISFIPDKIKQDYLLFQSGSNCTHIPGIDDWNPPP